MFRLEVIDLFESKYTFVLWENSILASKVLYQ